MIKFTHEQELAINSRKRNILVSASAGSGKTSVLVERIIKLITDKQNPIQIDKILAVTFTDAATWQIKKKIANKLREIKNPDDNIKRQIVLLNVANIFTLHAFCLKLVKKYFYLVGIDPEFRVAEENEINLIKSDILDGVLEKKYVSGDKNFFELAIAYNKKTKSDELKKLILKIYDFSRSICNGDLWLKKCVSNFDVKNISSVKKSLWWREVFIELRQIICEIKELIGNSIEICTMDFGPEKYIDIFDSDKNFFCDLENKLNSDFSFDDIKKILDTHEFKKMPVYTKKNIEQENINLDLKEFALENRKKIKKLFELVREKIFFDKEKDILEDISLSRKSVNELINVVLDFKNELRQKKFELNVLSFDDLEELALEILVSKRKNINHDFHEILTDEYQDINEVQEAILNLISCKSRFFVGDVKQSIYGFRNSSPELFVKKYNLYDTQENSLKINLDYNFRSTSEIVESVNFLFSQLMTKKFGGIDYISQRVIESENNICHEKSEFCLLLNENEQEKKIKSEANFICSKIKDLIKNKVCERFSDIALLIRSRAYLKIIKDVFLANNIEFETESDVNFFELPEIIVLISYLKIIDNPLDDIALVSVLRSNVYGVCDNELLKIREINLDKNFYECIKKYNGLEKFKSDLEILRQEKNCLDISGLIYKILDLTDFFYLADINNSQAQKNIIKFVCIAKDYEKTNYKGLFNFIRYLEKLEDMKINTNLQNKDGVKILTVHKSKGLEFKIVFFSFLGCDFNFKDLSEEILLDKDLGLGNKFIDINRRTKINTFARNAIELKLKQKKLEEEMRLLYVAMTRAKEKLILTGSVKKYSKDIFSKNKYAYKHAKNFLDWLLNYNLEKKFDFKIIEPSEIKNNSDIEKKSIEKKILPVSEVSVEQKMKTELFWDYKYDIRVKSKTSILELKKTENEDFIFDEPEFLKGEKDIFGIRKGSAVHSVLRNLDLNLKPDINDINDFLDRLVKKNIINIDEKNIIDISKIKKFLLSDLFYKIKYANFLKRELPFVYEFDLEKKNDDKSLIHGIIDCVFEYENKFYLLDYKTNKILDKNKINELTNEYRLQLEIYKSALEKGLKRQINFSIIYFFDINLEVYI